MNIEIILQAISSYGFPIIMSLLMMWYINKREEDNDNKVNSITKSLNHNTEIIRQNTEMIKLLMNTLGVKK